jgi:hypothetical protein
MKTTAGMFDVRCLSRRIRPLADLRFDVTESTNESSMTPALLLFNGCRGLCLSR